MELKANEGKNLEILAGGETWCRYAIQTRFVTTEDNYLDIVKEYVADHYQPGDLLSISEKIIAICQHRIVRREDLKVGFWANFLSKFANQKNRGGYGVGMAINMQYAIEKAGLLKVLWACFAGAVCKLFGKRGVFYTIVGREVSGLDGFYDGAWDEYRDIGIEIPENPNGVCDEIEKTLGIRCMIVDANDLGQEILGKSQGVELEEAVLKELIRDNPAGQGKQCTPLILMRKKAE